MSPDSIGSSLNNSQADSTIGPGVTSPRAPGVVPPDDASGAQLSDDDWLSWARSALSAPALGKLGPYELLEAIGHGAQGMVYRARQPDTHREVVIKRMAAGAFATPVMRGRFEREIEALASLNHSNIVTVYGAERVDGQMLLAMEWVDGVPVDRWAAGKDGARRSVSEIVDVLLQICDALRHAHQRGVIHRDLKPSNILIDHSNQARVLDFGLAKIATFPESQPSFATAATGFLGTPAYAAPEQIRGTADAVDIRSDVYSLGVIAYQLLTGSLPHRTDTGVVEIFNAILHEEPMRPSIRCPGLSAEIDAIVLKALAKDVDRRYQSADALADDLRRFRAGQTVHAHPPSTGYRLRKLVRRHRTASALVILLAVVLISATIVSMSLYMKANNARRDAERAQLAEFGQRTIAEQSAENASRAESESKFLAYSANLHAAESALRLDDVKSARAHLDSAPAELRGWEWRHLLSRTDRSIRQWTHPSADQINVCLALSPTGREFAVGGSDGFVRILDTKTLVVLRQFKVLNAWVVSLAYSPDGTTIVTSAGYSVAGATPRWKIQKWNASTGELVGSDFAGHTDTAFRLIMTPDGTNLISASFDKTIRTWDFATGRLISNADCSKEGLAAIAFHPRSRALAYSTATGAINALDLNTSTTTSRFPGMNLVNALAFSPDGSLLAVGDELGAIRLYDWETGKPVRELHGHRCNVRVLRFDHSGKRLVSGSEDRSLRIWRIQDGREIGRCLGHTEWITDAFFTHDSTELVSQANEPTIRVWSGDTEDVRSSDGYYGWQPTAVVSSDNRLLASGMRASNRNSGLIDGELVVHTLPNAAESYSLPCKSAVYAVAFSQDSRRLAFGPAELENAVQLVDAPSGRLMAQLKDHAGLVFSIGFSPDGKILAVGAAGGIRLWNCQSDPPEVAADLTLDGHKTNAVVFHPDGRLFTTWKGGSIAIWDPTSQTLIKRIETGRRLGVIRFAFSVDGALMFSIGANDQQVDIYDANTLEQAGALTGAMSRVSAIAVSPDGRRLAASDNYGTIILWDLPSRRHVATLHGHRSRATGMSFTPDNLSLFTAAADWTLRRWDSHEIVPREPNE